MESSQIGTHYARRAPHSSSRRSPGFTMRAQRVSAVKRIAIAVGVVIVLALIAVGVGSMVFFQTTSSRLLIESDDLRAQLTAPSEGEPYYALFAADLDASDDDEGFSADAVVLVRADASNGILSLVSVPSNMLVMLSDGDAHPLSEAVQVAGDAGLVSAVASFSGVDIAHYARTDAAGLVDVVDRLGGVTLVLDEEVDDPAAGNDYLPAGEQTLSGRQALTLARARNFSDGAFAQGENQCALLAAVAEKLVSSSTPALLSMLDALAGTVQCDLDANAAIALTSPFDGLEASSVFVSRVPGYETVDGDESYFTASSSAWSDMLEVLEAGKDPSADDPAVAAVDPGSFTITVRNGSGITGGASQLADTLAAAGYNVVETGNANSYVYTETLVVYADDEREVQAEAVVSTLGFGRAIPSAGFYTFDTDILVVLGSDFAPTA